jgi:hypothetical protein
MPNCIDCNLRPLLLPGKFDIMPIHQSTTHIAAALFALLFCFLG